MSTLRVPRQVGVGAPSGEALGVGEPPVRRVVGLRRFVPAGLGFSVLVYLLSRVAVVAGLAVFLRTHPSESVTSVAQHEDGWWYLGIARLGYTASLRPPLTPDDFHHRYSEWAFYPGYPMLIRGLHELTRLSYLTSALVAGCVLGVSALWAVYALGHLFGGVPLGRASALLVAAWPGSVALSLPYSEGLYVTATALALIALQRQQWLRVGVFGAIAMLTRPTTLALLAAIMVVAVVRLWRQRDWRPLGAAVLTGAGGGAFIAYGWLRSGDPMVWRHAENLWGQQLDFGAGLVTRFGDVLTHPLAASADPAQRALLWAALLEVLGLVMLLLMIVAALATRQWKSTGMVVYAVTTLAMIIGSSAVAPRPRMVLALLPGFVWLGAWLPRKLTIALSAVFLVLLGVDTYLLWQVTP